MLIAWDQCGFSAATKPETLTQGFTTHSLLQTRPFFPEKGSTLMASPLSWLQNTVSVLLTQYENKQKTTGAANKTRRTIEAPAPAAIDPEDRCARFHGSRLGSSIIRTWGGARCISLWISKEGGTSGGSLLVQGGRDNSSDSRQRDIHCGMMIAACDTIIKQA